jgi:hypothetical protein
MCEVLKKIDPDGMRSVTDEEWTAVEALIRCLDLEKEFEVSSVHGRKCLWDRDEDRPLDQEWALGHLAGLVRKPLGEYDLTPEQAKTLSSLLGVE